MSRILLLFCYTPILVLYVISFVIFKTIHCDLELNEQVMMIIGHLRKYEWFFLTIWVFMLQIFFLSLAILDEISRLLNLPSGLQKLLGKSRAYIFSSLVFPGSALVVFTFWSIWAVDRELIFPKIMDTFFPAWLNHVLHTFILIPLAIEILLPKTDNFIKFKSAAPTLLFYSGIYQVLYFLIYLRDGVWLYPVYKVLNIPQIFLFNLLQMFLILGFQYLGISLQNTKMKKTEVGRKKVK
ncbi:androgen-dependent TFPI-regulating protein-like isoform X3 [Diorhabda sublineata]|uniref:androgen-dependent TFPI-regulating protein-like isoform X3 n=1 Tax=Diorhabda sublineata TaxID=1163346 RepID=UPI0024E12649|nr:androgen-dependent TFPI-regulating protein-like isoform X3 [Diorhabda sublineata]